MTTTPIYASVCRDQGWSPDQLTEPFDLRAVITRSYVEAELRLRPWFVPIDRETGQELGEPVRDA